MSVDGDGDAIVEGSISRDGLRQNWNDFRTAGGATKDSDWLGVKRLELDSKIG
jgi:hypothetical protein